MAKYYEVLNTTPENLFTDNGYKCKDCWRVVGDNIIFRSDKETPLESDFDSYLVDTLNSMDAVNSKYPKTDNGV